MTNGRLAVAGLIGIALVAGVGIALTTALSDREPAVGRPRAEKPDLAGAPQRVSTAVPAPLPPDRAWKLTGGVSKVTPVTRRESARAGRDEIINGFSGLSELVRRCGAQEASFLLQLQAIEGSVRVESAQVEEQGTAPPAAVACAQSALSGQVFPAPNVAPGRRWEVPFSVGSL